jgi:hypothetical protein
MRLHRTALKLPIIVAKLPTTSRKLLIDVLKFLITAMKLPTTSVKLPTDALMLHRVVAKVDNFLKIVAKLCSIFVKLSNAASCPALFKLASFYREVEMLI